jgi:hypothetical protein
MSSGCAIWSRMGLKPSGADTATARWRRILERSFSGAPAAWDCTNALYSTWTSAFACSTVAPGFSRASRLSQLKSADWRCASLIIVSSGSMISGACPGLAL